MILSKKEMDALAEEKERRAVKSVSEHVRQHHTQAVADLDDDTLHTRVRAGLYEADRRGFTDNDAIVTFVSLLFMVGPGYFKAPGFQQVLEDTNRPLDSRVRALFQDVKAPDWNKAIQAKDDSEWGNLIQASGKRQ